MELEPRIYILGGSMATLNFAGEIVFKKILPFLAEYREWLYWRKPQLDIALSVAEIYNNKRHLSKQGSIEIIKLLYSIDNKYSKPMEYWLNLIEQRKWK